MAHGLAGGGVGFGNPPRQGSHPADETGAFIDPNGPPRIEEVESVGAFQYPLIGG